MTVSLDYLPTWSGTGLCIGRPEVMEGDEQHARALCGACPVRAECREWVLSIPVHHGPDGVVAGMTHAEREEILLGALPPRECTDCKRTRPLWQFPPHSAGRPSRRPICRGCVKRRGIGRLREAS